MKKRRSWLSNDPIAESFWPSFADLTSTISLILFVLVLLAFLKNLISSHGLTAARRELSVTMQDLGAAQTKLQQSERRLSGLERDLVATMAQLDTGRAQLSASEDEVARQRLQLAESHRELGQVRGRLQGIAVLRLEVLERVKVALEAELGRQPNAGAAVSIADNGNIVINERLVFEYDSHAIKDQGKPLLRTLARALANVVADPAVRESIDVILVQGHTDSRGSVAYNRELSAQRANAVLSYMFEVNPDLERSYGSHFASSAYSEFRPLDPGTTEEAHQRNRRIELSVVLKDTRLRTIIDEYMRSLAPDLGAP